ncbi:MAG: hypothetical protein NXH88_11775, partial [Hyphomonas sp.]|nr:hypothetical protein [Hyphomonas sp.]
ERIAIFAQPFKVVRQGKQAFGFHRSTSMLRVNHKPETKARFLRVSRYGEQPSTYFDGPNICPEPAAAL